MVEFTNAPSDWDPSDAEKEAENLGIKLNSDVWELINALQGYFHKHNKGQINRREITDALEEKFHTKGGMKFLYKILPQGPISQGCALAGIRNPAGNVDLSFGSVV